MDGAQSVSFVNFNTGGFIVTTKASFFLLVLASQIETLLMLLFPLFFADA